MLERSKFAVELSSGSKAIKIVQQGGRTPASTHEHSPAVGENLDDVRERLFQKLLRLKERDTRKRLAEGWTLDQASGAMIPPGWVRAESA